MRIVILGGYGVFGGRLVRLLADVAELELIICGRHFFRAQEFCDAYAGAARLRPLQLDARDISKALKEERPDLVVDASGPFQAYGTEPYRVIEACIASGVNYLDFADASDFVFGVSKFDAPAKARGVFVISGVSTCPALTAAVLREMAKTMEIVTVEGGIAPSPFAGIGLNVMRAVVGYAGSPVKLKRAGMTTTGTGLAESRRFTVAVPGRMPLRNIHFSLVDVPDLQLLPREHPALTDIWMGAGPVPEILLRVLNVLARARATFRLPALTPFSRLFFAVLNTMRFGEHRGGMFIRATGTADGNRIEQSWHLLAEGDDGPYIPSMAIEAVIRKWLGGDKPSAGARSSVQTLELSDYDKLFSGRNIFTGLRREDPGLPLYRQILGSAFSDLPPQVQQLHDRASERRWSGFARTRRGSGFLASVIANFFGFPITANDIPVSVTLAPHQAGELWTRNFDGRIFSSVQSLGSGRNQYLLVESFGWVAFGLALVKQGDRLHFIPRRWTLCGVPMPHFMLPTGTSYETEHDGAFSFNVEITLPFLGLIVGYDGTLAPMHAG